MRKLILLAVFMISGCEHHPLDCALGLVHSDCLPGTAGHDELMEIRKGAAESPEEKIEALEEKNHQLEQRLKNR